jgi:hypothetical protein
VSPGATRGTSIADRVEHPLSVYLREAAVMGEVDGWIAREFAPHRLNETIHDLAEVPLRQAATLTSEDEETARKIAECDRKLAGHRATRDAGRSQDRRRVDHRDRSRDPGRKLVEPKVRLAQFGFLDGVRGGT